MRSSHREFLQMTNVFSTESVKGYCFLLRVCVLVFKKLVRFGIHFTLVWMEKSRYPDSGSRT